MDIKESEREQAKNTLAFIVPILKRYDFRWVITGGFACYAYGVDRLLTDIDIDIYTSKDTDTFKQFYAEVEPFITQPLENFIDKNYNNFNFEITYNGQVVDVCPMSELKIFDSTIKKFRAFYADGFPPVEVVRFEGFDLPLLSKEELIKNKEMLVEKDEWQRRDIDALREMTLSTATK